MKIPMSSCYKANGIYILMQLPEAIANYEKSLIEEYNLRYKTKIQNSERCEPAYWRSWIAGMTGYPLNDEEFFVFTLPNPFRGYLALGAYFSGVPAPTLRTIVEQVWEHDHQYLMRAVNGSRATVRAMMRRAEFDISDLPETFTIYRGTSGVPLGKARLGLSWTTSYDVAAWFALRFSRINNRPLVIKAEARRSEAVFRVNGCSEQEVILSRALKQHEVTVAGDLAEWHLRSEARTREVAARRQALKAEAA